MLKSQQTTVKGSPNQQHLATGWRILDNRLLVRLTSKIFDRPPLDREKFSFVLIKRLYLQNTKPSIMKPTNFSYFLEKYPFNVCVSQDTYPLTLRPADPELTLDKAMTILTIAEEQQELILFPIPFIPTDFGFEEVVAEGINEHEKTSVYTSHMNPSFTMESHPTKAMTYTVTKYKKSEEADGPYKIVPEFSMEVFLPNQIIGRIVLQSIGFLPLHNPVGYYENTTKIPDTISTEQVKEEEIDTSVPVKIWAPMKFKTPEAADAFNAALTGKNLFLSDNPIAALNQIRSIHQMYKEYTFTGVEEAIAGHPNMTEEQKKRATEFYINQESIRDDQDLEEVSEEVPHAAVEPCSHCNGTGKSGVDLKCLWCDGTGKEMNKPICTSCNGTGEDEDGDMEEKFDGRCGRCDGNGFLTNE